MSISTNGRLPYGTGSIHIRSNYYWMVYRDVAGRRVQENTWTADYHLARRMVAERALQTARAEVAALEAIVHETEKVRAAGHAGGEARTDRGRREGRPLVRGIDEMRRSGGRTAGKGERA